MYDRFRPGVACSRRGPASRTSRRCRWCLRSAPSTRALAGTKTGGPSLVRLGTVCLSQSRLCGRHQYRGIGGVPAPSRHSKDGLLSDLRRTAGGPFRRAEDLPGSGARVYTSSFTTVPTSSGRPLTLNPLVDRPDPNEPERVILYAVTLDDAKKMAQAYLQYAMMRFRGQVEEGNEDGARAHREGRPGGETLGRAGPTDRDDAEIARHSRQDRGVSHRERSPDGHRGAGPDAHRLPGRDGRHHGEDRSHSGIPAESGCRKDGRCRRRPRRN